MFERKGQAALEFLTTYGWMFLVLVVVVSGLAYVGVFDGSSYISSSCSFDSSITCPVYSVTYDDSGQYIVSMQIENLLDKNIEVVNLAMGSFVANSTCTAYAIKRTTDPTYSCFYNPNNDYNDPDCRIAVSTYGSQDIDFLFDASKCNFNDIGLYNPSDGDKYSLKIGLIYFSKKSSKPTTTSGQLIDVVNVVEN